MRRNGERRGRSESGDEGSERRARALESPRRNGAWNGFGGRTVVKSGPMVRCGAHAPLFVLLHTECRWNAHWGVRRNHLRRSVEKLGFGSLAGEGVRPQAGGVRVMGRRTTEHRMRQRGCNTDHRVDRRAAGSSPQSGGLARRRGPSSSPAASPSRRAASLLHPRCYFRLLARATRRPGGTAPCDREKECGRPDRDPRNRVLGRTRSGSARLGRFKRGLSHGRDFVDHGAEDQRRYNTTISANAQPRSRRLNASAQLRGSLRPLSTKGMSTSAPSG
jgi:hypothetical protein